MMIIWSKWTLNYGEKEFLTFDQQQKKIEQ